MGKKGDLLRQQKRDTRTYTFTAAQLSEHDQMIIREKRDVLKRDLVEEMQQKYAEKQKEIDEHITEEWRKRAEQFQSGNRNDDFLEYLSCLLSVSARVLVEKFRWKPIPKDGIYDRRNHLMRFSDYVIDEISKISEDDALDIRKYNDETYDLYGVKFTTVIEGEENDAK